MHMHIYTRRRKSFLHFRRFGQRKSAVSRWPLDDLTIVGVTSCHPHTQSLTTLRIEIINPDPKEASTLCTIMKALPSRIPVCVRSVGVEFLDSHNEKYDVLWSLSVIEHIEGEHGDDREAVKRMYAALNPGGRLILTVPTDKKYWREYRDWNHYGTQPCETDGSGSTRYFFQRFYDAKAIQERIVDSIGVKPHLVQWYGEKKNGHFHTYIARWLKEGQMATLNDPHEFAINYNLFESWEKMPGVGVCGLVFDKPGNHK